jgi:regulatory protein
MREPGDHPDAARRARPPRPTRAERRAQRAQVDDPTEVLDAAARYLEARPRATAELRASLSRLGYRTELVDEVIGRLQELGYLDDRAFARAWIESRDRARPRGEHALRAELLRKGVDAALIAEALEDRRFAPAWTAASPDALPISADEAGAERLLRKRLPSIVREPDPRRRRHKAYALLARNGFAPDVCSAVVRRVLDEQDAETGLGDEP